MVRAGANYSMRHRFTVSADVSVHLPVCYDLIRVDEAVNGCDVAKRFKKPIRCFLLLRRFGARLL